MKKNVKMIAFAIAVCAVSALNVKVMLNSEHAEDMATTTLAAIGEGTPGESGESGSSNEGGESGESGSLDTNYKRNLFKCTIYGTGKIKIAGGNIIEVKGSLSFDGGVSCERGGNETCSPTECGQLWQWIF